MTTQPTEDPERAQAAQRANIDLARFRRLAREARAARASHGSELERARLAREEAKRLEQTFESYARRLEPRARALAEVLIDPDADGAQLERARDSGIVRRFPLNLPQLVRHARERDARIQAELEPLHERVNRVGPLVHELGAFLIAHGLIEEE